jgi:hypothetical protein
MLLNQQWQLVSKKKLLLNKLLERKNIGVEELKEILEVWKEYLPEHKKLIKVCVDTPVDIGNGEKISLFEINGTERIL